MISDLPGTQVPELFSRLCRLSLSNTRISYGEINDVLQEDQFLKLYVKKAFAAYLKKGGMLGMLTALGWEGFRNRLAEAYVYYARYGRYPDEIVIDEVHDVIDIEKRFEFLTGEGNSRTFLFGLYLKLCDIEVEKNQDFIGNDFITIPHEVDEILIKGKSKGDNPDWLIIITWILVETLGAVKAEEVLHLSKGKMNLIIKQLNSEQHEQVLASLLKYGFGINDNEFITTIKV